MKCCSGSARRQASAVEREQTLHTRLLASLASRKIPLSSYDECGCSDGCRRSATGDMPARGSFLVLQGSRSLSRAESFIAWRDRPSRDAQVIQNGKSRKIPCGILRAAERSRMSAVTSRQATAR